MEHVNNTRNGLALCGYIRRTFDKKYWIDEIIEIILHFYANKGGSLYVFGNGKNGVLGIKEYENKICKIPTVCAPFNQYNAMKVAASSYHTLVLDIDGDVWCFGHGLSRYTTTQVNMNRARNDWADEKTKDLIHKNVPTKLKLQRPVIAVSAGAEHSLLLCDNGWVQGFGSNVYGELGRSAFELSYTPQTIEKLKPYKIIQISAGGAHSAALTEDGALYCFGENFSGQCGVGKEKRTNNKTPTKVELNDKITFIDCGGNHNLVIDCNGLSYSFGDGYLGKLGHGDDDTKYVPTLIETLKQIKIKTCAAGSYHSLCIDEEGRIWGFGSNMEGQCAIPSNITTQTTPKMIEWFLSNGVKAKRCVAGGHSSAVISEDDNLYMFGSNKDHRLGLKDEKQYFTPTRFHMPQNQDIRQISMGEEHTAIIS